MGIIIAPVDLNYHEGECAQVFGQVIRKGELVMVKMCPISLFGHYLKIT